jgi:hypothetical protein
MAGSQVAIARGAVGHGAVTFVARRGGYGKAGLLAITLHDIDVNGTQFLLNGHFQEDGARRNGTAEAVFFAVGVASLLVKGDQAIIPRGRVLKARTGEAIPCIPSPLATFPTLSMPADLHVPALTGPDINRQFLQHRTIR